MDKAGFSAKFIKNIAMGAKGMPDAVIDSLENQAEREDLELDQEFIEAISSEMNRLLDQGVDRDSVENVLLELGKLSIDATEGGVVDIRALGAARRVAFGCPHAMGNCDCISRGIFGVNPRF